MPRSAHSLSSTQLASLVPVVVSPLLPVVVSVPPLEVSVAVSVPALAVAVAASVSPLVPVPVALEVAVVAPEVAVSVSTPLSSPAHAAERRRSARSALETVVDRFMSLPLVASAPRL
jgi:hypothetical protein